TLAINLQAMDRGDSSRVPTVSDFINSILERSIPLGDKLDTIELLEFYLKNVIRKPNDPMVRKIGSNNRNFTTKIQQIPAALNVLLECGFEDSKDYIILPPNSNPDRISAALPHLENAT